MAELFYITRLWGRQLLEKMQLFSPLARVAEER